MDSKVVFFDIDGTLWDRHNYIPDSTREAIKKLKQNGHFAFINTGRTRGYVTNPDLLSLGFDGIVCGCGTMVEYNSRVEFLYELDSELIAEAITSMREFGMKPIIEGKEYLYMEESDFINDPYGKKLLSELGDRRKSINDEWGKWEGSKMSCEMAGCDYNKCFSAFEGRLTPLVHNPHVAEVVPTGFSKGTGIIKTCEILGISIENTVAIGDSVNDLDMLRQAQYSVAMGGAPVEVQNASTFTTKALMEDGIYKALDRLNLL